MKAFFWSLLLGLSTSSIAQDASVHSANDAVGKPLRVMQTTTSPNQVGAATLMPVRCDSDGSIYVRFYHDKTPLVEPIHKLDNKGEHKLVYSVAGDAQFVGRGKGGTEFAIGKNGDVYQLASADDGTYAVAFNKDGSIRSKAKLVPDLAAWHFAVFESGRVLVAGTERETVSNLSPHAPFTGIFDPSGKLLHKIVFPEDKSYEDAANRGDSDFFDAGLGGGGNFAVEHGSVERGSDGNIYVVRWVHPAKVYAVAETGQVVRTFEVRPELEGRKPAFVYATIGKLAFQFAGDRDRADPRSIIKVVGLDGRDYVTYDSTALGVGLACYSQPDRFTFLGTTKEGKLKVDFAAPN